MGHLNRKCETKITLGARRDNGVKWNAKIKKKEVFTYIKADKLFHAASNESFSLNDTQRNDQTELRSEAFSFGKDGNTTYGSDAT